MTSDEQLVDWLDGTGYHELTEREQALMDKAREAGYAEGERHGYRQGGQDALRAATELSTLLSDRRWLRAIETLRFFTDLVEDERTRPLWKS